MPPRKKRGGSTKRTTNKGSAKRRAEAESSESESESESESSSSPSESGSESESPSPPPSRKKGTAKKAKQDDKKRKKKEEEDQQEEEKQEKQQQQQTAPMDLSSFEPSPEDLGYGAGALEGKGKEEKEEKVEVPDASTIAANLSRETLAKNLKKMAVALTKQKQQPQRSLEAVAHALAEPGLLKHKNKEVRLLVACCISDILRIFAPNPPYTERQLKSIFELFLEQLRGLATAGMGPDLARHFYLLESLALFNSCLLLVMHGMEGLIVQLFGLFFELAKSEQTPRVEFHIVDILVNILEEMERPTPAVLDALLINLTKRRKDENPAARNLAIKVITRAEQCVERPILDLLNDVLVRDRKPEDSEITERSDALEILYELAVGRPSLLIPLLPAMQDLLEVEGDEERLETCAVFGRMFAFSRDLASKELKPVFQAFLRRNKDKNKEIRALMGGFMKDLLLKQPQARPEIWAAAISRLRDKDHTVRAAVVTSLCEAGLEDPAALSNELVNEMLKRIHDRKTSVRRAAMEGAAELFRKHCTEYWKKGQPLPEACKRYSFIPRKMVSALASKSPQMMLIVESLLDDVVLGGTKNTIEERARCLIGIYASFDTKVKSCFSHALAHKRFIQQAVLELLSVQDVLKAQPNDASALRRRQVYLNVLPGKLLFEDEDKGELVPRIRELIEAKDKNIAKWLRRLADPLSDAASLRLAKTELCRAVRLMSGSSSSSSSTASAAKSAAKKSKDGFASRLAGLMSLSLVTTDSIPFIFKEITDNLLQHKRAILSRSGLQLCRVIAEHFPELFLNSESFNILSDLATNPLPEIATLAVEVLSRCKVQSHQLFLTAEESKRLLGILQDIAEDSKATPEQGRHAVRAVHSIFAYDPNVSVREVLQGLIEVAVERLDSSDSQTLATALAILGEACKYHTAGYAERHSEVFETIRELLTSTDPGKHTQAKLEAITLLVNHLSPYLSSKEHLQELPRLALPSISLLLDLLKRNGFTRPDAEGAKDFRRSPIMERVQRSPARRKPKEGNEEEAAAEEAKKKENEEADQMVLAASKAMLDLCSHSAIRSLIRAEEVKGAAASSPSAGSVPSSPLKTPLRGKGPSSSSSSSLAGGYYLATLGLTVLHPNPAVSHGFLQYLVDLLQGVKLPFMPFASLIALAAAHKPRFGGAHPQQEAEGKKKEERHWTHDMHTVLLALGQKQRNLVKLRDNLRKSTGGDGKEEESSSVSPAATQQMPEFALADLVYLLAQPAMGFDDSALEKSRDLETTAAVHRMYDRFRAFFEFFIDGLLTREHKHYGLMLQILERIKMCEDARNPSNTNLYKMGELALLVLQHKYQGKDWGSSVTAPASAISLPLDLYRPRASRTLATAEKLLDSRYDPYAKRLPGAPGTPARTRSPKATPSRARSPSAERKSPEKKRQTKAKAGKAKKGKEEEEEEEEQEDDASASEEGEGEKKKGAKKMKAGAKRKGRGKKAEKEQKEPMTPRERYSRRAKEAMEGKYQERSSSDEEEEEEDEESSASGSESEGETKQARAKSSTGKNRKPQKEEEEEGEAHQLEQGSASEGSDVDEETVRRTGSLFHRDDEEGERKGFDELSTPARRGRHASISGSTPSAAAAAAAAPTPMVDEFDFNAPPPVTATPASPALFAPSPTPAKGRRTSVAASATATTAGRKRRRAEEEEEEERSSSDAEAEAATAPPKSRGGSSNTAKAKAKASAKKGKAAGSPQKKKRRVGKEGQEEEEEAKAMDTSEDEAAPPEAETARKTRGRTSPRRKTAASTATAAKKGKAAKGKESESEREEEESGEEADSESDADSSAPTATKPKARPKARAGVFAARRR